MVFTRDVASEISSECEGWAEVLACGGRGEKVDRFKIPRSAQLDCYYISSTGICVREKSPHRNFDVTT